MDALATAEANGKKKVKETEEAVFVSIFDSCLVALDIFVLL